MTQRAIIYTRVSSDGQDTEDSTSLDVQAQECAEYAASKGYEVVQTYREVASGADRRRPMFTQMLDAARAGLVDVLIGWRSDRFARGVSSAAELIEAVDVHDVAVESVRDTYDRRLAGLMASIWGLERDAIKERTVSGRRAAAAAGRLANGRVPFGYINEDSRPVIDHAAAAAVREAFELYASGAPARAVGVMLEARTGGRWNDSKVHRLLSRPHYKGEGQYGVTTKKQTENGIVRTVNEPEKVVAVPYPVIVGEDLWGAVQDRKLRNRQYQRRGEKRFYLLAGLAKCAECGSTLTGQAKTSGRTGGEYLYYRCTSMKRLGWSCRESSYVRADALERRVWATLKDLLADPWTFSDAVDQPEDNDGELGRELLAARRERDKVGAENDRLVRAFVSGIIGETDLVHQRKYITERMEWTTQRVTDLEGQERARVEHAQTLDSVTVWAGRISEGLDDLDPNGRRDLLRTICESVYVNADNEISVTVVPDSPSTCRRRAPTFGRRRWTGASSCRATAGAPPRTPCPDDGATRQAAAWNRARAP